MLKQDQAVTITGDSLNYDGVASRAVRRKRTALAGRHEHQGGFDWYRR
jgi:hypothetical protein